MLRVTPALVSAFSLMATGQTAPAVPRRDGAWVRKRDGHVCAPGQSVNSPGKPRRKRAGRVSARAHHNHGTYLKRARKRRVKKERQREVRAFIRQTARDYFVTLDEQLPVSK